MQSYRPIILKIYQTFSDVPIGTTYIDRFDNVCVKISDNYETGEFNIVIIKSGGDDVPHLSIEDPTSFIRPVKELNVKI